jgi:hypothetical protein
VIFASARFTVQEMQLSCSGNARSRTRTFFDILLVLDISHYQIVVSVEMTTSFL